MSSGIITDQAEIAQKVARMLRSGGSMVAVDGKTGEASREQLTRVEPVAKSDMGFRKRIADRIASLSQGASRRAAAALPIAAAVALAGAALVGSSQSAQAQDLSRTLYGVGSIARTMGGIQQSVTPNSGYHQQAPAAHNPSLDRIAQMPLAVGDPVRNPGAMSQIEAQRLVSAMTPPQLQQMYRTTLEAARQSHIAGQVMERSGDKLGAREAQNRTRALETGMSMAERGLQRYEQLQINAERQAQMDAQRRERQAFNTIGNVANGVGAIAGTIGRMGR